MVRNKLRELRKELVFKALTRTQGNLNEAYKLLCPNGRPFKRENFPVVISRCGLYVVNFRPKKQKYDK